MEKQDILLASIYTGYNYGTSLQANAMKMLVRKYGFNPKIVAYGSSLKKGRDIRITKLLKMFSRTFFRPSLFKKTFLTYTNSIGKAIDKETKDLFISFSDEHLCPHLCTNKELKKLAKSAYASLCGSAQIWNPEAVYVSPLYYLRFSPKHKRIAYAPSLGKDFVPKYNQKLLKKYITEIDSVSVRETTGQKVIRELTAKNVPVVLDPTLLFGPCEWREFSKETPHEDYVLIYFLDPPSKSTIKLINGKYKDFKKVTILYDFEEYKGLKNREHVPAGPGEFLSLIEKAEFVFTDSFHGLAFCINFNKKFFIFDRNYGIASPQQSRITSILEIMGLENARKSNTDEVFEEIDYSFEKVNDRLQENRNKSFKFMEDALKKVSNE